MAKFDKPKVTIDLDEYLALKEEVKFKSRDIDYEEAFNLLFAELERRINTKLINERFLENASLMSDKYSFAISPSLTSNTPNIRVRLKESYKIQTKILKQNA